MRHAVGEHQPTRDGGMKWSHCSHQKVDYFPITALPEVFYRSYVTGIFVPTRTNVELWKKDPSSFLSISSYIISSCGMPLKQVSSCCRLCYGSDKQSFPHLHFSSLWGCCLRRPSDAVEPPSNQIDDKWQRIFTISTLTHCLCGVSFVHVSRIGHCSGNDVLERVTCSQDFWPNISHGRDPPSCGSLSA